MACGFSLDSFYFLPYSALYSGRHFKSLTIAIRNYLLRGMGISYAESRRRINVNVAFLFHEEISVVCSWHQAERHTPLIRCPEAVSHPVFKSLTLNKTELSLKIPQHYSERPAR
jgi:hypothetical protein